MENFSTHIKTKSSTENYERCRQLSYAFYAGPQQNIKSSGKFLALP